MEDDGQAVAGDRALGDGGHAAIGSPGAPRTIQAVDRAIRLLGAVASSREPRTVLELARVCGLSRSTAWRLLATLERHGLVERDPLTGRYSVGYGVVSIASAADHVALARRARPVLEGLAAATGETVNLSVVAHTSVIAVEQIEGKQVLSPNWIGKPLPLHGTSVGKLVLASLGEEELEMFLRCPLERYTSRTITDSARLREEIETVRRQGYAVTAGEYEEGLIGISAPVADRRGQLVALVSISGPSYRVPLARADELGLRAIAAAAEIHARLDDLYPAPSGEAR